MASQRDIRILALQTLFHMDIRASDEEPDVQRAVMEAPYVDEPSELERKQHKTTLSQGPCYSSEEKAAALAIARHAWQHRQEADGLAMELAPAWPTQRQPGIDRALIRLAYWEMASGATPPKVVINEAIELAKVFSTERSPAFVNGILDKIMKRLREKPAEMQEAESDPWLADAVKNHPPISANHDT